jgi:hypothetical protein
MLTALLLLILFFPQQQTDPIKIKCVMVNVAPFRLVCDDKDTTELEFPVGEFPEAWIGRGLGGTYNAELRDGVLWAVETPADPAAIQAGRVNLQRRISQGYRIPPLQASGRP